MIKLSIIIPYYETLELTKRLFEVLLPQLTNETEVILVDDGCNEKELDVYSSDKVKIIHCEVNSKGCAIPRNIGLDNAKGKFIAFIDSDDMVTEDYIEKIMNKINTSDFDYCFISWKFRHGQQMIIKDDRLEENWSVWSCLYKRELIGNERFNPKKLAEDKDFNLRVIKGSRQNITDIIYIYYSDRRNSLMDLIDKGERTEDML
jgi:glycosyltransferase involved in cell wall biosynthesis